MQAQPDRIVESSQQQPAAQQRNEQVWVLLLSRAWQPLQQQVVCRLLCCSNSMAQLVHSTCAGRLPVVLRKGFSMPMPMPMGLPAGVMPGTAVLPTANMPGPLGAPAHLMPEFSPADPQDNLLQMLQQCPAAVPGPLGQLLAANQSYMQSAQPQLGFMGLTQPPGFTQPQPSIHPLETDAPSKWMAKHAVLLSRLELNLYDTSESLIAEGLKAAAAAAAAAGAAAQTAGGSAQDSGAAAAVPAAARPSGGLPLQSLSLRGRSDGSVLCSLAGSLQLTKLAVGFTPEAAAAPAVPAALQDLSITECTAESFEQRKRYRNWDLDARLKDDQAKAEARKAFEQLTPALQALTLLTRLVYGDHVPVRQAAVQPLPASLVTLQLGQSDDPTAYLVVVRKCGLNLSHLTRLTHLTMADLQPADVLPPALVSLLVPKCLSLAPALDLQHLQKLRLGSLPAAAELAQLAAFPSLQELHLEAAAHESSEPQKALKKATAHLPTLPLKSLILHMFDIKPAFVESLSICTGLTKLNLHYCTMETALDTFGAALRQLTALEKVWSGLSSGAPGGRRRRPSGRQARVRCCRRWLDCQA